MKQPIFLTLIVAIITLFACGKEDNFLLDSDAELTFSVDTLRFDTVFTELGSATRTLKIFNPNDRPVNINEIRLVNGDASSFRLNVDGLPTNDARNIEVAANDSVYVFAEVTVDPDNPLSISPFVISEELMVKLNGVDRIVQLEAWGQNANYIPDRFSQGSGAFLTCDLGEVAFNDPKPYVIYGALLVDSCTLNIPAGTQIYVHGGIVRQGILGENYNDGYIVALPNGRLSIEGTADNPVVIQGDRLEEPFQEVSGQWGGIWLTPGSRGHKIEHTVIKNAIFGMIVDSSATLIIENSQILNAAGLGMIGIHSRIKAENCLFAGNGGNAVEFRYGGSYTFDYCTLASYGVDNAALRMGNVRCLDQLCTRGRFNDLRARFKNSIIFGSRSDEIDLFRAEQAAFDYEFENCIVRVDDLVDEDDTPDFFDHCVPCQPSQGVSDVALFKDPSEGDFTLDSLSIAEGFAAPIFNVTIDLLGNDRDAEMPDAGCFEKIE
ncbi:MAG: right-handed parallel beta-helix repeat-containing protein [Bacteroidota bacterium]